MKILHSARSFYSPLTWRNRAPWSVSFFVLIFLISVPCESGAAPSNGAYFPAKGSGEFGYEYNIMFERRLDRSYGKLKTENHFYTVSLGIFDWLALDGKIGIGDVTEKGALHLPKLEYNAGFAGGYGFRVRVFNHEKWGLWAILGGQHISVHPEDRSIDNDKFESFLDDWQISSLIAKDFKFLTAYVGIKASDSEIVYKINKHDKKRRFSKNHIGFLFGSDFFLFERKTRVNLEARLFDENAFSASINYLF